MDDYSLELDDEQLENYDEDAELDDELDDELDNDNFDDNLSDNLDDDQDNHEQNTPYTNPLYMDPEEAGYADGFFDAQINSDYASFGASIDLDQLTDEERDNYEQAYTTSLYSNKKH